MIRPAVLIFSMLFAPAAALTGCGQKRAMDMSDAAIRARILTELKSHADLDLRLLQVNVHVRVVYLSGVLPNPDMRRKLARVVRRVPGVNQVVTNILIQE